MRIIQLLFFVVFSSISLAQIPTAGLVSYYPFNGSANDAGSAGNNGTVNGATLTTDRFGATAKAYSFNGTAKITAADNQLPLGNAARTVSMWINFSQRQILLGGGPNAAHTLKYGTEGATSQYYNIGFWGNNLRVSNWSSPPDAEYSYYHPIEEWFQLIVRLDTTGNLEYFINGAKVYESNVESWNTVSTGVLTLGEFVVNGKLDDIRIYNRKLCDVEITQLYEGEATPANINLTSGLVAYYPFNGNSNDASGNGNNAAPINGPSLVPDRNGNPNAAYQFDGVDDYLTAPASPSLNSINSSGDFSFCAWVKSAGDFHVVCKSSSANDVQYRFLGQVNNGFNADVDNKAYGLSQALLNNEWMFVTCIKKGDVVSFYKNGILLATPESATNEYSLNLNSPLEIGRDVPGAIEYTSGALDEIRIYNRALNGAEIQALYGGYQSFTCVNWQGIIPALDPESAKAIEFLCASGVIQSNQQPSAVVSSIRKDELAKILYKGLFGPSGVTFMDDAPNPFADLQPGASFYIKEAKVLSYLEWQDGVSVFKRELSHFRPQFPIIRMYVVKAMLETFNIKPYTAANAPVPSCWYNDVPVNNEMYYYILKAREMGFIKQQASFNPNNPITRKEAFLILYRILKYFETTPKPVVDYADFFVPSNYNPYNFGRTTGISDANFNAYTKTSFAIPGLMPLTFAHAYNSILTELPDSSYNIIEPLGKGWTHNYNCYLQRVADELDNNINYVITWGDGTMNSFIKENDVYKPITAGVYSTLTYDNTSNTYIFKTKSQITYAFSRYVLSTRTIWVLTSIKDRNNNALTLTWTPFPVVAVPSQIRLFKVEDGGGRFLQFAYEANEPSKIKTVTAVTGSITRSIGFSYENGFSDLKSYINLKGDTTFYSYGDSNNVYTNHLLVKIKLPKGNVVDNTYERRKLKSTELQGQYKSNVNWQYDYNQNNNTNFTQAAISTTRDNVTLNSTIKQDKWGNIKNAETPTGNLDIEYNDVLHTMRPTFFRNNTNALAAGTIYDAQGNITSITKTGGTINLKDSFTYNQFNDLLTYINARGFKTEFVYNASGNLIKVKDALGFETNMNVNSNGTVSKITNPEGIYSDFQYDVFGNTTQTSLMNTIITGALYDRAGRVIQQTDPNGVITQVEYEVNDLIKKVVVDPSGIKNAMQYRYDLNDNLDTIINPKGGKTSFKYNEYDQMVEYRFGTFTKTYAYNEDGTLKTFTNQRGDVSVYTYNVDGQLTDDGYAAYGYDAQKRLKIITHKTNNSVITYFYDDLNRINRVGYSAGAYSNEVAYEYDNNGNIIKMIYPGGFTVAYTYDELDRLVRVYNEGNNTTYAAYEYLKDGRLKKTTNGNSTYANYGYDNLACLNTIDNRKGDNSVLSTYSFEMDNIGNHTKETANEPFAPPMPVPAMGTLNYTHDNTNRMTQQGSNNFNYDGNGNNTNATGQWTSTYTYDRNDNLLTSTAPSLTVEYDALENRRRKNNTRYVLDILGGSNVLMETDANGTPQAYYIHGLGLICRLDAAQTNAAYYHYDYRGSTTAITNAAQVLTHKYVYGAFGEMLKAEENGFANSYRYVGKYGVQYEDSTLYFMRARYYNPKKGRFLGEDPVWNMNLFGYVGNNAINYYDNTGNQRQSFKEFIAEGFNEIKEGFMFFPNYIINRSVEGYEEIQSISYNAIVNEMAKANGGNKYKKAALWTIWSLSDLWINTETRNIIITEALPLDIKSISFQLIKASGTDKIAVSILGKTGILKVVNFNKSRKMLNAFKNLEKAGAFDEIENYDHLFNLMIDLKLRLVE